MTGTGDNQNQNGNFRITGGRVFLSRFFPILILSIFSICAGELLASDNPFTGECPDSPNCVSTKASQERSRMNPIVFQGSVHDAQELLLSILLSMPGVKIVERDHERIQTTFTSAIFGFVDDVEFVFDDSRKLINFRSASRTGYYDLGVNRRRMESITEAFTKRHSQ